MGIDHSKYQNNQPLPNKQPPKEEKKETKEEVKEQSNKVPMGHPKIGTAGKCPLGFGATKEEKKEEPKEMKKEEAKVEVSKEQKENKVAVVAKESKKGECSMWGKCEFMQNKQREFKDLPSSLSALKFTYVIEPMSVQQRCLLLGFSSVLVGLASRKVGFSVLQTARNTFLGFYGVGLVVAPEIYNPRLFAYI